LRKSSPKVRSIDIHVDFLAIAADQSGHDRRSDGVADELDRAVSSQSVHPTGVEGIHLIGSRPAAVGAVDDATPAIRDQAIVAKTTDLDGGVVVEV
jgi:hypothetical protein